MEIDSSTTTIQQHHQQQSQLATPPTSTAVVGLHYDIRQEDVAAPSNSSTATKYGETFDSGITIASMGTVIHNAIQQDGYDFITCRIPEIPISNTTSFSSGNNSRSIVRANNGSSSNAITTIDSKWWRTSVVGVLESPHCQQQQQGDTTGSTSTTTTQLQLPTKERILSAMEWCIHMNIPAILLPSPFDVVDNTNNHRHNPSSTTAVTVRNQITVYANHILSCLITLSKSLRDLQIWIPYTHQIPTTASTNDMSSSSSSLELLQYFYRLLDYHPNIYTVYTLSDLSIPTSTTATPLSNSMKLSWEIVLHYTIQQCHISMIGCIPSIAAIQIPTNIFLQNKRGFPTLSKYHQMILCTLFHRLCNNNNNNNRTTKDPIKILVTQTMTTVQHYQLYQNNSKPQQLTKVQLGASNVLPHLQYLHHLRTTKIYDYIMNSNNKNNNSSSGGNGTGSNTKLQEIFALEQEYNDVLQVPLQPLADHLENYTYEIFEQDPIKYVQYENAIYATIVQDYYNATKTTTMEDCTITVDTTTNATTISSLSDETKFASQQTLQSSFTSLYYIVLVVGAGRGPLVTCTMNAYQKFLQTVAYNENNNTNHNKMNDIPKLYLYAIEKNPNAILYLQSKFANYIQQPPGVSSLIAQSIELQIVQSDLRYLNAHDLFQNVRNSDPYHQTTTTTTTTTHTHKANLIVSELLGSFGCNELSPECLDTLIHKTNVCSVGYTKSIPYHYTSHITPISSIKLYNKVKQQSLFPTNMTDCTQQSIIGFVKAYETPYVVRPHIASQIYPTQDCWSFTHPASSSSNNQNNILDHERYVHLEFPSASDYHPYTASTGSSAMFGNGYGPYDDTLQSISSKTTNSAVITTSSSSLPWICTGLLGTFTADLYQSSLSDDPNNQQHIYISTNPTTYSTGMFSWFPLYFPSMQPIHVPCNGKVHIDIWRKANTSIVWYEWLFTVLVPTTTSTTTAATSREIPMEGAAVTTTASSIDTEASIQQVQYDYVVSYVSPIHNPGGRSSFVSLA